MNSTYFAWSYQYIPDSALLFCSSQWTVLRLTQTSWRSKNKLLSSFSRTICLAQLPLWWCSHLLADFHGFSTVDLILLVLNIFGSFAFFFLTHFVRAWQGLHRLLVPLVDVSLVDSWDIRHRHPCWLCRVCQTLWASFMMLEAVSATQSGHSTGFRLRFQFSAAFKVTCITCIALCEYWTYQP